jgi:hypothetical protein
LVLSPEQFVVSEGLGVHELPDTQYPVASQAAAFPLFIAHAIEGALHPVPVNVQPGVVLQVPSSFACREHVTALGAEQPLPVKVQPGVALQVDSLLAWPVQVPADWLLQPVPVKPQPGVSLQAVLSASCGVHTPAAGARHAVPVKAHPGCMLHVFSSVIPVHVAGTGGVHPTHLHIPVHSSTVVARLQLPPPMHPCHTQPSPAPASVVVQLAAESPANKLPQYAAAVPDTPQVPFPHVQPSAIP